MVNIAERSEKERNLFRKYDALVEITERIDRVLPVGRPYDFAVKSYLTGIVVYVNHDLIDICSKEDLEEAIKLAELYESAVGEEFTVKKDYDD